MFDYVFLPNPSLKSTFAQNESCRSSVPLQLLFWPNFKLLYKNLSFGWSNSNQFQSNELTVPPCTSTMLAATDCRRLHASRAPAILALRARGLSSRVPWRLLVPIPFFLLERAEQTSRAVARPPTVPRRPARILRAPTSLALLSTSSALSRARSSQSPAESAPVPPRPPLPPEQSRCSTAATPHHPAPTLANRLRGFALTPRSTPSLCS